LAALAGAAVQLLPAGRGALGVAAAVLAALAGAVTAFEALIGFEQLRKLYGDAALGLAEAELDWDAAGATGDLDRDVRRIERVLRAENGQWGQLVLHRPTEPATESTTEH